MENREPIINNHIDQLTLDFLMNRSQYKKYVEKNDPTKHIENEKHLQKILKYKNRISNITSDLLDNPEIMITLDVSQSFDRYVRTLIRYFEEFAEPQGGANTRSSLYNPGQGLYKDDETKDLEKYDNDALFDDMDGTDLDRINLLEYRSEKAEQKMAILQKVDESIREPEKLTTSQLSLLASPRSSSEQARQSTGLKSFWGKHLVKKI